MKIIPVPKLYAPPIIKQTIVRHKKSHCQPPTKTKPQSKAIDCADCPKVCVKLESYIKKTSENYRIIFEIERQNELYSPRYIVETNPPHQQTPKIKVNVKTCKVTFFANPACDNKEVPCDDIKIISISRVG
ncbi:hypothetical protein [Bacillus solitudinis]|uniref:hypothetical protein n=1 Tax=Bacillus solitudinis TaxID=2014074 RepID=UPI000C23E565|nr:hypothetical protein [Bacillus solitudinis]